MRIDDMRVGQYLMDAEQWGNEDDPQSDWHLLLNRAPFVHREACEFIIALSDDHLNEYRLMGLSNRLMKILTKAYEQGFRYICLYG